MCWFTVCTCLQLGLYNYVLCICLSTVVLEAQASGGDPGQSRLFWSVCVTNSSLHVVGCVLGWMLLATSAKAAVATKDMQPV